MNVVQAISITQLNNGDFYQFIENVVTIVQKEALAAGVIQTLAQDQPQLLNSYKKEQLTEETKQIVALDMLRDRSFLKIKYMVDAYTFDDENAGFSTAANKVLTFLNQLGDAKVIRYDYNKETATISSLVSDLNAHASTELTLLGLKSSLDFLATSNDKFKDFYATRGDAASMLKNVPPFYKLRRDVREHYRTMVTDLESLQRFVAPADASKITDVITRVNIEIDKFKLLVPKTPPTPTTPAS